MRKCNECKQKMNSWYCIDGGIEYYCSDECLHKHYSEKERLDLYNEGDSESYRTEREEEEEEEEKEEKEKNFIY